MVYYDTLLARSFSKYEQKKLKYGALVLSLVIALIFCTIFEPYLDPLHILNSQLSIDAGQSLLGDNDDDSSCSGLTNKGDNIKPKKFKLLCKIMERTDYCEIEGDIRIDSNSATVYVVRSETERVLSATNTTWKIKPYARKKDEGAMGTVREWSIKVVTSNSPNTPRCTRNNNVPGVLFSLGGYAGNHFHDFADVIIPLFATSKPFNAGVKFLITDKEDYWIVKYAALLKALSRYEITDIDKGEGVNCFGTLTIGLKGRCIKELTIDPSTSKYNMKDFRNFLFKTYSLNKAKAIKINGSKRIRPPRLLIIPRNTSRAFTNINKIAKDAESFGFDVVVVEPDLNVARFAQIVNSCDVMMGVHGAGLTNMVFMPENGILIQVVPFGGADWLSDTYFGEPSKGMDIRYLKYKIKLNESTLVNQYPSNHILFRDPEAIKKRGWMPYRSIYFDKQNVRIDLDRFRPTLLKTLELLRL